MNKVSDCYLTREDWDHVRRRFDAGSTVLMCELVDPEPVLCEAMAHRIRQFVEFVDAQELPPTVKHRLKLLCGRAVIETVGLTRRMHDKVMADLLPGPDLRVNPGDEEAGQCKEQP